MKEARDHSRPARSDKPRRVVHFPCEATNQYNRLVAEALRAQGVDVVLRLGSESDDAPPTWARKLGPIGRLVALWRCFSWASTEKLVHWHWISHFYNAKSLPTLLSRAAVVLLVLTWLRLRGTKMVMTVHNLVPHDASHKKVQHAINRCLGRLMHRLHVHSPDAAEVVGESFGSRGKIRVVEHVGYGRLVEGRSIDAAAECAAARRELGLDPARDVALSFGMVRNYKRPQCLLRAAKSLTDRGMSVVIAGQASKELEAELKALAGDTPHVYLRLQFLHDEPLHKYLTAASVSVFCYADALTSGAAHLSLSYGLPLVSPDAVAFREFARLGLARTCDVTDPAALAEAIVAARNDKTEAWNKANGAYLERCSPASVGKAMAAVYAEI
jgi:glycosyltransferase involved in cell wall biosynthesis